MCLWTIFTALYSLASCALFLPLNLRLQGQITYQVLVPLLNLPQVFLLLVLPPREFDFQMRNACPAHRTLCTHDAAHERCAFSDAAIRALGDACGLAMFPELYRLARVISGVELGYYFSFLFK